MSRPLLIVAGLLGALGIAVSRSVCVASSPTLTPSTTPDAPPALGPLSVAEPVRQVRGYATEIAPSLLELDDTSATLVWVTREASVGRIEVITETGPIESQETEATRHHRIRLEGLRSGTHYAYTVDDRFRGEFDTHRPDMPFRFVVFGHPGGTQSPAGYPFAALADRLDGLDPAFALCTGDLCYYTNERSFEELYFDPFEEFLARRPIYVAPGNHEAGFPPSGGIGYDVFRRLFPYSFGAEDHAYHSFVQGNVEFFAFAYGPASKPQFAAQMEWLKNGLAASRSEFRIVYLGGAQDPTSFDRKLFFRTAKEGGASFVFGGDGSGSKIEKHEGLDFFFAGTTGQKPHDFFMVQTEPYRLEVTRYDASFAKLKGSWIFNAAREKNHVLDALPKARKGRAKGAALYGPFALPSTDFHGVEVHVHNPFKKPAVVWLRWAPDDLVGPKGDYHYREEARRVEPGVTKVFRYHLPAAHPRTGEPWTLGELEVRIGGFDVPRDFDMTEHVVRLTAFADPLLTDQ